MAKRIPDDNAVYRSRSRSNVGTHLSVFWFFYQPSRIEVEYLTVHIRRMVGKLFLAAILITTTGSLMAQQPTAASHKQTPVSVPFVGCPSDGQMGAVEAPTGISPILTIPAELAQRLAYYSSAQELGVLGPRGWHCFGRYGSGGAAIYVSRRPIDFDDTLSVTWIRF